MPTNFRRHLLLLLVALASGAGVGAIASAGSWSNAALYLATLLLIVALCAVALIRERRGAGPRRTASPSLRRKA